MGVALSTTDERIARIATRQHGVVSRAQLLLAGISAREIEARVNKGTLIVVYRGVYRVGHSAPSTEAAYMAAVLACGDGSLLAGRSAAYLLALIRGATPPPQVIARWDRRIPGLATRRCRTLLPEDVWAYRGIPVLSPARCLVDLARSLPTYQLGKACHEAGFRYETTPGQVGEILERIPNTKGARRLKRVLGGEPIVLSRLEKAFIRILKREGLPLPVTNRTVGGRRVDCRWPAHRLTVELDSFTFHNSRHSWEADRRREREAHTRGDELRRYTWGDVVEDSTRMLRELHDLLSRRAHLTTHAVVR